MVWIFLGAMAYPVLFLFDLFALRGRRVLSGACGALGVAMIVSAFATIAVTGPHWPFPSAAAAVGWAGALPAFLLIVYSLFIELPFRGSGGGLSSGQPALVSSGTYALTRHPGVLWWALFLACLAAAAGRPRLLVAAAVWTGANALYVAAQERYIFPALFGGAYENYKRTTPMLVPTLASLRRCLRTWRGGS